jgi:thiol-disulfide isomerase/thioredoxin
MMSRALLLLLAVLTPSCSGRPLAQPHTEPLSSEPVVGRNVHDLDFKALGPRRSVRLVEFRGKALLLNVWASWCAPCRQELPRLDDAVERLRAKGVEIVAVSIDESDQEAEDFLRARSNWSLTFAHDPGGQSLRRLAVPKMPTSYLIDGSGVIREVHPGSDEEDFQAIESKLVGLAAAP